MVAITVHAAIPAIPSHRVPLASTVAGAAAISTAHIGLPIAGPAIAFVILQCTDFVDILNGVSELVGQLQIARTQFTLPGQLFQLHLEFFLQLV